MSYNYHGGCSVTLSVWRHNIMSTVHARSFIGISLLIILIMFFGVPRRDSTDFNSSTARCLSSLEHDQHEKGGLEGCSRHDQHAKGGLEGCSSTSRRRSTSAHVPTLITTAVAPSTQK